MTNAEKDLTELDQFAGNSVKKGYTECGAMCLREGESCAGEILKISTATVVKAAQVILVPTPISVAGAIASLVVTYAYPICK